MTEKDPYLVQLDTQIERANGLKLELLECRLGGLLHSWRLVEPDWKPTRGVRAVAQQCDRCLAIKRSNVSIRYGELLGPVNYEYPMGYELKRPEGVKGRLLSAQAVRASMAKRAPKTGLPPILRLDEMEGDA